uniref:Lipoprotein n=1 Tax=Solibacter usitatus (strain Ellin6076) TaxID=234267 RepID=Q01U49_SOLUE
MISRVPVATLLALCTISVCLAQPPVPQPVDSDEASPVIPVSPLNENRIFGVIPDYQTVTDTGSGVKPLTPGQKWSLALKETVDPFNVINAAMGAAFSQRGNQTPKYGEGGDAYGRRFGAALADFGTQNFFSAGLLAVVLHQDPRYYRKGPGTSVVKRAVYSVSRLVIARQDSGAQAFNTSGIGGMMMGIAASNLYYPAASRRGSVMMCRISTSLTGGIMGNLMSEFWPDIQKKFFHKHSN